MKRRLEQPDSGVVGLSGSRAMNRLSIPLQDDQGRTSKRMADKRFVPNDQWTTVPKQSLVRA